MEAGGAGSFLRGGRIRHAVLAGLDGQRISDSGHLVRLGELDWEILTITLDAIDKQTCDLVIELPKGSNEIATIVGAVAQLARLGSERVGGHLSCTGPVIVVGRDTLVAERLSRIRVHDISLSEALGACRLRYDGRLSSLLGVVDGRRDAWSRPLVYLNTRVGWPALPRGASPGLVVIDKTSMSGVELYEKAISWALQAGARRILVVACLGDSSAQLALASCGRQVVSWNWGDRHIEPAERDAESPASRLTANALVQHPLPYNDVICIAANAVDERFRAAWQHLGSAARVAGDWPRGLAVARRLVNALTELACSLAQYNSMAAPDPRVASLASLRNELDGRSLDGGPTWAMFADTQWAALRHEVEAAYDLLAVDNPKLYALAVYLEQLRQERPRVSVIVRTSNAIAAYATQADLRDLLGDASMANVGFATWSDRFDWSLDPTSEVQTAGPARWRIAALFSREADERTMLCYPHEIERGARLVQSELGRQREAVRQCGRLLGFEPGEVRNSRMSIRIRSTLEMDHRPAASVTPIAIEVDTDVLFGELLDDAVPPEEAAPAPGSVVGGNSALPVVLMPDGACYWVRPAAEIEAVAANRLVYVRAADLKRGDTIVVPRGEGREQLFARLVRAAGYGADMAALSVLLGRWRAACWHVHEVHGTWQAVEHRMRAEGSSVTWQSYRGWAIGLVIGPDDPLDIQRIGRVSEDRLIEHEYRRVAAVVNEVRRLHGQLGRVLSAALREAVAGGGPNVQALGQLLGGIDVSDLLEEFELRQVMSVGPLATIAASRLWTVEAK